MIWLEANWRYVACGLLGLILGVFLPKGQSGEPKVEVKASQAQSGTITAKSHIVIEPVKANGPCPELPKITVDCGGEAKGSQNQAITATASVKMPQFGLWAGLGATKQGGYVSAMLMYGPWALTGQYGPNEAIGADIKFKALEF